MRPTTLALSVTLFAALVVGTPAGGQECSADTSYDSTVTPPELAIPGFPDRRATTQEIIDYFRLVDGQSDRVDTADYGTSWNGRPLVYSLVATEGNLPRVDRIAAEQQRLRDPRRTSPAQAAALAASRPAIVWYTGNVHGNEMSGADAAITILYELAARTDCAVVEDMLGNLVVGIIPTQNPDGRDTASRRNTYGFDLNRDWFAWTQRETEPKMELLSRYPPLLFIDAHEMGGTTFFFPPNADPIYHEISDQSLDWIATYGAAMAEEFDERGWDYFNYDIYDLFYMGYGDSVPTTAFTSAGMTFEKGIISPDRQRWHEQLVAGWTSLEVAADRKQQFLSEYYEAHSQALADGRAGRLEPNEVQEPGNEVISPVPDLRVRHYFLRSDGDYPYVSRVVERLLQLGVEVYQLREDLPVGDLRAYGRATAPSTVPAGSYWIPMAQPQKRWVQAMFHEDTYVPFPYFYDVTAWSNPLLMNLDASFSGEVLEPDASRVRRAPSGRVAGRPGHRGFFWWRGDTGMTVAGALAVARAGFEVRRLEEDATIGPHRIPGGSFVAPAGPGVNEAVRDAAARFTLEVKGARQPPPGGVPVTQPKVALFSPVTGGESLGHLRFVLEREWEIPYSTVTSAEVTAGALTLGGYDVFIVPGVNTTELAAARTQIRSWIEDGGIYIGTSRPGGTGGTPYAVASGWTSSSLSAPPGLQIPGTLFRVDLGNDSPLTLGGKDFTYWYHLGERRLSPSTTGINAGLFPGSEPDFWFSGYAEGEEALKGSAALVEEGLGDGRVVLFSGEPNYRAYTEGSAFLLANALAYPSQIAPAATDVSSAAAAPAVSAARESAAPATGPGRPIRIEVPAADADEASRVLGGFTGQAESERARGSVFFSIPNREGLSADQHPFARELLPALRAAGVKVRSAIL